MILQGDVQEGRLLVLKAFQKREEERLWDIYKSIYPNFTQETFLSFEEFKKRQTNPKMDSNVKGDINTNKTDEEIISNAEDILRLMGK